MKYEWRKTTDDGETEVYEAVVPIVGEPKTNDAGDVTGDAPVQYDRYVPIALTPATVGKLLGEFAGREVLSVSAGDGGVSVRVSARTCSKCGARTADGASYCAECGQKLKEGSK